MNRPENQIGWRTRFDVDGFEIEVFANHHRRNRVARGHEIMQQISRGRPAGLVEEVTQEWRVSAPGLDRAVVRPNPNGTFSINGRTGMERDLLDAVRSWASKLIEARGIAPAAGP